VFQGHYGISQIRIASVFMVRFGEVIWMTDVEDKYIGTSSRLVRYHPIGGLILQEFFKSAPVKIVVL
jgi:hypothetical protein